MMKFGLLLLLTVATAKAAEGPLFNDILKNVASRRTVLEKRQSGDAVEDLGCWTDTGDNRTMSEVLFRNTSNTVAQCRAAVLAMGWSVFGIQAGQTCRTSATAAYTYQWYGESTACNDIGTGGPWANQVYRIVDGSEDHCDVVYIATAEPGRITSPGYPGNYSNNIDSCFTVIYANESQLIHLNFEEFHLEAGSSCSYDYLEVRDGDSSTSPLLGSFCGSSSPGNITSSGNSLWINFHSDGSVTEPGFLAYFTAVDGDVTPTDDVIPTDDVRPTNGTDNEYELVWAGMYTMGDGGRVTRTNNGLVIIVLVNTRTGEEHAGTVCDDGFSDASADIGCQLLGYDYAYSWENHGDFQHIPASMIEEYEIGIVADEFRCPEDAETLDDCSYNLLTHDCSHQEDIVLDCAGEDPFTPYTDYTPHPTYPSSEYPTWRPTSSDLDDEVAVKFGGLEVKLKVNPKSGRAEVADILEEIGDFLG